jgi:hypothetical protein
MEDAEVLAWIRQQVTGVWITAQREITARRVAVRLVSGLQQVASLAEVRPGDACWLPAHFYRRQMGSPSVPLWG